MLRDLSLTLRRTLTPFSVSCDDYGGDRVSSAMSLQLTLVAGMTYDHAGVCPTVCWVHEDAPVRFTLAGDQNLETSLRYDYATRRGWVRSFS